MQYEPTLERDALVDLALRRYFERVDAKDMAAVLDCFHDEALFTVQTAFTRHAGKPAIERMFAEFFAAYETIVHRGFTCTVDAVNGRIAAAVEAVLTDAEGRITRLNKTNFWRVRDGRFQEVHVYMSGANVLV